VVINTPSYPPFFTILREAGCRTVESPLDDRYRPDLDLLADQFAAGARAYLLCNPHNPTGTVLRRDELVAIAELADRYGVLVLSDEVHAPLVYPGAAHVPILTLDSPAAARASAFVSASKAWNLPGLKSALAIAGPEATALPTDIAFGASLFGVLAGEAALRAGIPWLDALLAGLDSNRRLLAELLADQLPEVGYRMPEATYLAWLDCRALGLGEDPAAVFLERGRVALSPGPDFGAPGRGFARLNLATAPELIVEAVRRMAGVLRS
jgi:cysteine-S-conjugate beta-lyase